MARTSSTYYQGSSVRQSVTVQVGEPVRQSASRGASAQVIIEQGTAAATNAASNGTGGRPMSLLIRPGAFRAAAQNNPGQGSNGSPYGSLVPLTALTSSASPSIHNSSAGASSDVDPLAFVADYADSFQATRLDRGESPPPLSPSAASASSSAAAAAAAASLLDDLTHRFHGIEHTGTSLVDLLARRLENTAQSLGHGSMSGATDFGRTRPRGVSPPALTFVDETQATAMRLQTAPEASFFIDTNTHTLWNVPSAQSGSVSNTQAGNGRLVQTRPTARRTAGPPVNPTDASFARHLQRLANLGPSARPIAGTRQAPATAAASGTASAGSRPGRSVWTLSCADCQNVVCIRGMRAILLSDNKCHLFSTDAPPSSRVVLLELDYQTRNCQCRLRDVACGQCGNVIGYHVTQPCQACLSAANNGHFWMFLSQRVSAKPRVARDKRPVTWSMLHAGELADPDPTLRLAVMAPYEQYCR